MLHDPLEPIRVTKGDLLALREILELKAHDFQVIIGRTLGGTLTAKTGKGAEEIITDPSLSIETRILLLRPECSPLGQIYATIPSPSDLFTMINRFPRPILEYAPQIRKRRGRGAKSGTTISASMMGLLFGARELAGSQWINHGVVPSTSTNRLMWPVRTLLEQEREEGFALYLRLLDAEIRARGYEGGLAELVAKKTWPAEGPEVQPPGQFDPFDPARRVTRKDLGDLREVLGALAVDMVVALGRPTAMVNVDQHQRVNRPAICLTIRLLYARPQYSAISQVFSEMPTAHDVWLLMNRYGRHIGNPRIGKEYQDMPVSPSRMGPLCGVSQGGGGQWINQGMPPAGSRLRLLWVIYNLLSRYKSEGFELLVDVVDAEYRSRGGSGIEELMNGRYTREDGEVVRARGWRERFD